MARPLFLLHTARLTECSLVAEKVRRTSYLSPGAKGLSACRHITLRARPSRRARRTLTSPSNTASYASPSHRATTFRPPFRLVPCGEFSPHVSRTQAKFTFDLEYFAAPAEMQFVSFCLRIYGFLLTCLRPR